MGDTAQRNILDHLHENQNKSCVRHVWRQLVGWCKQIRKSIGILEMLHEEHIYIYIIGIHLCLISSLQDNTPATIFNHAPVFD